VWFYAQQVVHVRILGECIDDLFYARRIAQPWRVRLTFSEADNAATAFALEPAAPGALPDMQADARAIAEEIGARALCKAEDMRRRLAL
ncbi:MAG: hypothetical protein R3C58_15390, partial [Parvularculaceae bacterium]